MLASQINRLEELRGDLSDNTIEVLRAILGNGTQQLDHHGPVQLDAERALKIPDGSDAIIEGRILGSMRWGKTQRDSRAVVDAKTGESVNWVKARRLVRRGDDRLTGVEVDVCLGGGSAARGDVVAYAHDQDGVAVSANSSTTRTPEAESVVVYAVGNWEPSDKIIDVNLGEAVNDGGTGYMRMFPVLSTDPDPVITAANNRLGIRIYDGDPLIALKNISFGQGDSYTSWDIVGKHRDEVHWAIARGDWIEGTRHPYVAVIETDFLGNLITTEQSIVYLPRTSVGDPAVFGGSPLAFKRDRDGNQICVTSYMDSRIGTVVHFWDPSSSIASPPSMRRGWTLCNGANGSPDMTQKDGLIFKWPGGDDNIGQIAGEILHKHDPHDEHDHGPTESGNAFDIVGGANASDLGPSTPVPGGAAFGSTETEDAHEHDIQVAVSEYWNAEARTTKAASLEGGSVTDHSETNNGQPSMQVWAALRYK